MKNMISSFLLLFAACFVHAQGWERFYGTGSGVNTCYGARQLSNGEYMILANNRTLIKTDELGFEKWRRPLPNEFMGTSMFPLPSGNLLFFSSSSNDMMETDTAGNQVSTAVFDADFLTTSGMFMVEGGFVTVLQYNPDTIRTFKMDINGNFLWSRINVIAGTYPGGRASATPDGGFIYVGPAGADVRLAKFDAEGIMEWTTIGGTPDIDGSNMIVIATSDGGYAVITDNAGPEHNQRLFKFDSSGSLLWWAENTLQAPYSEMTPQIGSFIEDSHGGFVFAGGLTNGTDRYPTITRFTETGVLDFFYVSQYLGNFYSLRQTLDGGYHVAGRAINSAAGSTSYQAYTLKITASGLLYPGYLAGQVSLDQNNDCLISASDIPLNDWVVKATSELFTVYGSTNAEGRYLIGVDTGDYIIEVFPPNDLWAPCENLLTASLTTTTGDTLFNNDFPVQAAIDCPAMQVDLATPFLRRCFNANMSISYCNLGTLPAEGASIDVTLDDLFGLVSSDIAPLSQTGNTYSFPIGDVGIGECGSFNIVTYLSCEAELGQTLCMEAHAFPDTICGMQFNWSGASMIARAHCQGDTTVVLELENIGTAPTSEALDYIVIEDQIIFLQGSEAFDPLEVLSIPRPANGSTWRITSEQEPNHPDSSFPTAFVEGCGTNEFNTFSMGFVNEHPLADGSGALDIDCETVVGSFDPNDKMGIPIGYGAAHYIEPGTDIEYRIRFQNTGTDTAFTVVIRDTLSVHLDPATLRVGAASHDYEFSLEGDAVAIFRFDNILLPDSNVNEALSHGFISFRISQKPEVPLESVIENEAAIYFDFNDPVITNQTSHTIGRNFIEIINDVADLPEGLGPLLAYPNPSGGLVTFEIPSQRPLKATFALYDALGRRVLQEKFEGLRFLFDGSNYEKGIYFYKVELEGLGAYAGKVILK